MYLEDPEKDASGFGRTMNEARIGEGLDTWFMRMAEKRMPQ